MRIYQHPVDVKGVFLRNAVEVCAEKVRFHPTDIETIAEDIVFNSMSTGLSQARFAALVIKELIESSE